ncbi:hypothetical protein [uncultured Hyphomonas sp.]|uniref:CBU_0592 family membrane protein n=1 Tax=uncultured Hyphomonas sp. TaxID=225298 RepID=UPI002AAAA008|nr:hypothetical protein [uncultured Hyphomonas sp.]
MSVTHFLIEISGWAGAVLILIAYLLLSAGKMDGRSKAYQVMNAVGATGFIINSGYNGAIPSTTINVIWVGISIYALWQGRRLTERPGTPYLSEEAAAADAGGETFGAIPGFTHLDDVQAACDLPA